jgi:hypothetical protein
MTVQNAETGNQLPKPLESTSNLLGVYSSPDSSVSVCIPDWKLMNILPCIRQNARPEIKPQT